MNISKTIALCAIAGTVMAVGYRAAHAQAVGCQNQPMMQQALGHLLQAQNALSKAESDKGGWRGPALVSVNNAVKEAQRGCAFTDTH